MTKGRRKKTSGSSGKASKPATQALHPTTMKALRTENPKMAAFGFAVAFETSLSLQEMLEHLNQQNSRWKWVEWQNDSWGDYIRGIARSAGDPSFKILYDEDIKSWAMAHRRRRINFVLPPYSVGR